MMRNRLVVVVVAVVVAAAVTTYYRSSVCAGAVVERSRLLSEIRGRVSYILKQIDAELSSEESELQKNFELLLKRTKPEAIEFDIARSNYLGRNFGKGDFILISLYTDDCSLRTIESLMHTVLHEISHNAFTDSTHGAEFDTFVSYMDKRFYYLLL